MVFGSEVQRENTWLRDPATWLPTPRPLSDVVVVVVCVACFLHLEDKKIT